MKKPQHCGLLNNNVTNYIRTTCIYNRLTNVLLGNMVRQRHMLSRRHTTYHKLPWFPGHCHCDWQYQEADSIPLPVKQSVQISVCLSVCLSVCVVSVLCLCLCLYLCI